MKVILYVFFALLSCCSQKTVQSGTITFEKVGNSDKPFTTIIISTYDLPEKDFTQIVIVDKETFSSIRVFVDHQEGNYGEEIIDKWSAFQVSVYVDGLSKSHLIPSREKSIDYFKKLKSHLNKLKHKEGVSSIQKELDIFLKRIGS